MSHSRERTSIRRRAACVLALLMSAGAAPAAAQSLLTVTAGPSQYDLSGTGTAPFAAIRAMLPFHAALSVEPSLGWMSYDTQSDARSTLWFPEAQLVAHPWTGLVRPYVGAGAGLGFVSGPGDDEIETTLSVALGALFDLNDTWGVRGELRMRAIDPWVGTTADWGLGVTRRF